MGWTSTETYKGIREFMRDEFEGENEHGKWKVIQDMATGNAYYAIMTHLNKETNIEKSFVLVCKVSKSKNHISYKDMTESQGPYIYGVNKKFLDAVKKYVPLEQYENESMRKNADEWRLGCEAHIEREKKARKKVSKNYPAGTKIIYGGSEYVLQEYLGWVRGGGYRLHTGQYIKVSQLKRAIIVGQ